RTWLPLLQPRCLDRQRCRSHDSDWAMVVPGRGLRKAAHGCCGGESAMGERGCLRGTAARPRERTAHLRRAGPRSGLTEPKSNPRAGTTPGRRLDPAGAVDFPRTGEEPKKDAGARAGVVSRIVQRCYLLMSTSLVSFRKKVP